MSDRRVGEGASQASTRGDETPFESAGGEGIEACSCERIEGGDVLNTQTCQRDSIMFDTAIPAPRAVFNRS